MHIPEIHRSISMPGKPIHAEDNKLKRSEEHETLLKELSNSSSLLFSFESDRRDKILTEKKNSIELTENLGSCAGQPVYQTRSFNLSTLQNTGNTRIVDKNGYENIHFTKVPSKGYKYCKDIVTTIVDQKWKYTLVLFFGSFFLSWFFFTVLWYMIAYAHGDLFFDRETGDRLGDGNMACIHGVKDMIGIFVYSVETQTTIGFGEKYPTEECPESIFLYLVQIIVSIAIEGAMVGVIYAKTARPAKKSTNMKFSKQAVVCLRDDKLCLTFRVFDPREQHSVGCKIRMYLIVEKSTIEGEPLKLITELPIKGDGRNLIMWPETIVHIIDTNSPFYGFTAKDFHNQKYELLISLVGTSTTTGQLTEARTSYLPKEIFWGQRFTNIISYDVYAKRYSIDYSNFNTTISIDMASDSKN